MTHVTPPVATTLTKYEYARMRGFRLQQLSCGAIPLVHVGDSDDDEYDEGGRASETVACIFDREAHAGMLPFRIQRDNQTVVSCYKACLDVHGRLRTIAVAWRTADGAASGELVVQPSVSVARVFDAVAERHAPAATLCLGDGTRLARERTLWDYGVVEDVSVVAECA